MNNRTFPTTTHTFLNIINDDAVYVDKTQFIMPLIAKKSKANFFLSRPRRFGKSLFVSTLEYVFRGKKEMFKGLYIYDKIEWETFPVIRLSMDAIGFQDADLKDALYAEIKSKAKKEALILEETHYARAFAEFIQKLAKKHQKRVVVLIDEYDKPIIHGIEKDNADLAETNRDILKSFYGILKDSGEYLRFVFMTGVSKFSKVSIFSDLNYFTDLTLKNQFATICGFTEAEIRQYCYGGLEDLAVQENTSIEAVMDKIRFWYNGFSWNAVDFVYNPFSTMHLMDSLEFKNYWFESGTPTFLVKLINARYTYNMKDIKVKASVYDWYDLRNLDFYSIMLQTGYLTFKKSLGNDYFIVNYPNKEVENAFCEMLLSGYFHKHPFHISVTIHDIEEAIENHEIEKAIGYIKNMFKTLPSQFFQEVVEKTDANGNVTKAFRAVPESFYHAIIYLIFNILGIKMQAEVTAQEGRIDAVVETEGYIYLFEFKKNRKASVALDQIKTKKYAELYALSKKQIFLVGVSFSLQKRGISDYLIAPYSPS